ncbi:hypothetical protein [Sphingomonas sp. IC081]|uniref:COG4705 family protein n=1 Tax=Sphingomonas sp. IC081 TaxID=304378 RepID=UPI00115AD551|nr:hypothetical protein [Sphingomonas sp. IC081]QDK35300.1 hypothetical protein DM450_21335 [Sphingomonas sp. IC081]
MKQENQAGTVLSKVPEVTLGFWIIKIFATTLGETGGDTLSMTCDMGYLLSSLVFVVPLVVLVLLQVRARGFIRWLYWATIIASTTAGTTMADFATRSLGIGYLGGSLLLGALVMASLLTWKHVTGTIAVESIVSARAEWFYWITITFSQTLGTALGDWAADDGGLGYLGGAALFGGSLAALEVLRRCSPVSPVLLFWAAFVLTRPLGATLGDFLDKPLAHGGLDLSRPWASSLLACAIVVMVAVLPQRAGRHPG